MILTVTHHDLWPSFLSPFTIFDHHFPHISLTFPPYFPHTSPIFPSYFPHISLIFPHQLPKPSSCWARAPPTEPQRETLPANAQVLPRGWAAQRGTGPIGGAAAAGVAGDLRSERLGRWCDVCAGSAGWFLGKLVDELISWLSWLMILHKLLELVDGRDWWLN